MPCYADAFALLMSPYFFFYARRYAVCCRHADFFSAIRCFIFAAIADAIYYAAMMRHAADTTPLMLAAVSC